MPKVAERREISAILLAGGAGRRVGGQDKGWLLHRGRPLVEIALERLRASGLATIVISANRNLERYAALGALVISDDDADFAGPLAGIAAGLAAVRTPLALTIPVDVPAWPTLLVEVLSDALAGSSSHCCVAHDGSARQPLFALYRAALCAAPARAAVQRGRRAVHELQSALGVLEVPVGNPLDYENLNSLETFA